MRSSVETKTAEMIRIVETTVMVLASEKWLFKTVAVLNLAGTALTAAIVQNWQCLNYCSSSSVSMKAWTCS